MEYRFPHWKDAIWNSYERQLARYNVIRDHLGADAVAAELGVYKGGFGEFLKGHCRKLYLVDWWYRAGGFWNSGIEKDSRVDTVINILQVHKPEIEAGRIEVVIETAEKFLSSMAEATFDFIYIDASHAYDHTVKELRAALPRMKPGGRMFGDDYDPDPQSKQHGVYRAVNEFVAEIGATMIVNESRQWGIALPESRPLPPVSTAAKKEKAARPRGRRTLAEAEGVTPPG